MSVAAIKPYHRKGVPLVVLRPLEVNGTQLMPGDVIPANDVNPLYRTAFWARLGKVGPQGHPWTIRQLSRWEAMGGPMTAKAQKAAPAAEPEQPILDDETAELEAERPKAPKKKGKKNRAPDAPAN